MALTDKVAPDTRTSLEGHRRGHFEGKRSSVPKPQGDSESPVGLGRSATRQLRGFRCHAGVDDKATPGTETARSFSNEATLGPGAASSLKGKATSGEWWGSVVQRQDECNDVELAGRWVTRRLRAFFKRNARSGEEDRFGR